MKYLIQPWAHQLKAIGEAANRSCYALFFEQGTGKTGTMINILRHQYAANEQCLNTLILCPQIVIENWKREFLAHSDIHPDIFVCLRGSEKKRIEAANLAWSTGYGHVYITNYEAMLMTGLVKVLADIEPYAIVLDESHKIKELTAKRTKAVLKLAEKAPLRYILSGTPIVNSPMDIFSQFLFLDRGESFGTNFFAFRHEYFADRNRSRPRHCYFPDWQPKADTNERINKLIYKKGMRVLKKDCLDLPPFVRQYVDVEMSSEQNKAYKDMERDSVAVVSDRVVSADMAITKALRMQQIVTGFVKDDNDDTIELGQNRINALCEVIDFLPGDAQFIIWAVFKENYRAIRLLLDTMGVKYGEIVGGTKTEARQEAIDGLESGKLRAILAHPGAGGVGANLTAASYAIYYSRDFSLENDLQSEARNYRGGSDRHRCITRIDLVTPGTTDEIVLTALKNKQNVSEQILKYLGATK